MPNFRLQTPLSRRAILRGAGIALSLPLLEAMTPWSRANAQVDEEASRSPRRMLAINTPFGLLPENFFPETAGRDYTLSPYLEMLKDFRQDYTVFSGVSHPDVDGGHASESTFLTAAPHPGSSSFRNSISLDQFAAERIGSLTRFPYLALSTVYTRGLSWTRSGVQIPAEISPARVFAQLFLDGTPDEVRTQVRHLKQGQSILDTVAEHARRLQGDVGPRDRQKLDQYFTSVRELEKDLVRGQEWATRPKPKVDVPPPQDSDDRSDIVGRTQLMCDLAALALETDSTRLITLAISGGDGVPPIPGVMEGYHILSHHGRNPEKLAQIESIERGQLAVFASLLKRLKSHQENSESLLDRTMVLFGSNLGSGNNHSTRNMPMLLAGGGFRHGQHLVFDQENNYPLTNIFVSMLQRLGLETDTFASSTGTCTGLEMV